MISSVSPAPSSPVLIQSRLRLRTLIPKTLHFRGREKKQPRIGRCRAEFAEDASFAAAIGACVLNSLIFPLPRGPDETDNGSGSPIDSTDTRFSVMGIISFIPYFNWLSWFFAWLDTNSQRYLVYSIVYLAPYLRTNLSLSPEESWLPIASIIICIVHVQLEASIKNGDIRTTEFLKSLSLEFRNREADFQGRQTGSKKRNEKPDQLLPCQEEHEKKLGNWSLLPRQSDSSEQHLNGNGDQMED